MPIGSVTELIQVIDDRAKKVMRKEARGSVVSFVDPAYPGSGQFKDRRPNETSTPNITHPILRVFGLAHGNGSAVAGDKVIYTPDGKYAIGIEGDPGGDVNANQWGGHSWVIPGSTNTLLSADTERSTTSASYTEVKRFALANPGRYRVTLELARSGGSGTNAKLQFMLPDGTWVDCSSVATSSSTYPTFSTHTLDMTVTVNAPGTILRVVYQNNVGGGNTSYIKNVSVKFDLTIAAPALYSAVITD